MTLNPESFRHAMRVWTTGVGVLMSVFDGKAYGMTINSFTSISLDPPLVTVVLKNHTYVFDLVIKSQTFSVTLLSAEQQEIAEKFAGELHGAERMAAVVTQTLSSGMPVLPDGLAWLDCRVIQTHAAGMNTLFIAEVTEANVLSAGSPLVYHDRGYHQLEKHLPSPSTPALSQDERGGETNDRPIDS